MDGLDFSVLSDDQLLQLVQAALEETFNRGNAIHKAAMDAKLEAEAEALKDKQNIDDLFQKRVADLQRKAAGGVQSAPTAIERDWQEKAAIVYAMKAFSEFFEDQDFEVGTNISMWWGEGGSDRRVYLERNRGSRQWKITCYVTGNKWNAPLSLTGVNEEDPETFKRIQDFCQALWNLYGNDPKKFSTGDILKRSSVSPDPAHLKVLAEILGVADRV